ncbi:hypothetical protein EYD45_08860 [Hyunsoonleella flava]|uniref:Glycosyltransferase RgtA/B/C/D-like domain-containing protein n=1 Tax=Hyunsoonleella flava TaxID=2527939 RepID=A0A4Q9FDS5_9FLAO|nr:hypothetical protein [Hyunsoonleella flava]TBN03618.1 hypothetical protein EYD45_08860 [Hyunsoonleella flava]
MKTLNKQKIALVIGLNLTIAVAYYLDNLNANYSELSSDIQNIIPVAQKFDNPELFKNDLYVNDINNVKYYTPFYVQTLRFIAKFTNNNYVQAINVLGFICHLLFGILWFFLLYKFVNNYWAALLVSVMIRGVVWLPGLEIWGISDLWTIMPRTVYITLLPIPYLLISKKFQNLVLASFAIGLIFNFHPITGLGGVLAFILFVGLLLKYYSDYRGVFSFSKLLLLITALCLGVLPFVLTYFGKTSAEVTYDLNAFNEAFIIRIPEYFRNPILFLKQWLSFKSLFFIVPLICFLIIAVKTKSDIRKPKILLMLTILLVVIPSLSIPVERAINSTFDMNLRMSFQLIRMQKVAIIPGFFALAYVLDYLFSKAVPQKVLPVVFALYMCLLVFSESDAFTSIPFFGDDISKSILPHNLSAFTTEKDKELAIDKMAKFIAENTNIDDVICGSYILRGATKRSIIFDGKGTSMLIEGNPKRFMEWQERLQKINNFKTMDEVINYLKLFGTDYYVTPNKIEQCELIHTEGKLKLYKL